MDWIVCLVIALVVMAATIAGAIACGKAKYKSGRVLDATRIMFFGTAISSFVLFVPIYTNAFAENNCGPIERVLIAIHNVIRLFVVDGEFGFITENMGEAAKWVDACYSVLFAILFVAAPLLTFGFVLSFFKNISAYRRYAFNYNSDVYVFSELNEKSLALATDLSKKNGESKKRRFFVFADVFETQEENNYELIEKAKSLGAICFKKDILAVNFSFHSKKANLFFFAIGEDQSETLGQALKLIERFKYRKNTHLYVFSAGAQAELLLSSAFNEATAGDGPSFELKVRRVNEVRSLINHNLYNSGYENIFASAREDIDGAKKINAVVIGMGHHGTEMTKALSWFCQMDGYRVEINSFDLDEGAESRFIAQCPELMDPRFNDNWDAEGDAQYKIKIHSGIDVETTEFYDILASLPKATYVFVALGNDERNIAVAVNLRSIFKRAGFEPKIQAIVYSSDKKKALEGVANFKNQPYNIEFIGDVENSFSESVVMSSDLEKIALARHTVWGAESEFWQFDYNYKSSVASAIHRKMKLQCQIPGADLPPEKRAEADRQNLRVLEHRRWNAYVRSEGYVYGGTTEKKGRDDMAKTHNCLVPFSELPLKEQEKDDD